VGIMDKSIALNRKMAYVGELGKSRELFCQNYIKEKKERIEEITRQFLKQIENEGKTTPCKQGCPYSTCCNEYVDANLQECEAIVYYLYQNENILAAFLKNYEIWRQEEKETLALYRELETLRRQIPAFKKPPTQKVERFKHGLQEQYFKLNLPCPFLGNNQCLIYEVRPLSCVAYYSIDPIKLCSPLSTKMPTIKRADDIPFLNDEMFYYGKLDLPLFTLMPLGVYRIISEGYSYLSTIRELSNIKNDAMRDPEIASIKI
jgi:Fe-S-cluster containining protein